MELVRTNLNILTDIIPLNHENQQVFLFCSWVAFTFSSYVISLNFLRKVSKAYIIHEAVPKINQFRFVNALWRVIFSVLTIVLFSVNTLDINRGSLKSAILQAAVPKCNSTSFHRSEEDHPDTTFLVASISFFLHQLYISISSFTEPTVISMGCLCLFVFSTNSLQCPKLCFQILFMLALNVGTLELARTIYALKSRCKGFSGPPAPMLLRFTAIPVFIFHLLVWMFINFYWFPLLYMSLPSVTEVRPSLQTVTAYINIFLIFYAKKQFFDSPAWSLMKLVLRKPSETGTVRGLQSLPVIVLLPYSSPLLPELRTIQLKFLLDALPTSAERRLMRKKLLPAGQTSTQISEEKADFASVVKCVKILKRKMRYRYEQKTTNEASTSEQHSSIENSPQEVPNEVASSDSLDVTDIFIPVPLLQTENQRKEMENFVQNAGSSNKGLEITADVHFSADETGQETDICEKGESSETNNKGESREENESNTGDEPKD